jgi:hypothetical protein
MRLSLYRSKEKRGTTEGPKEISSILREAKKIYGEAVSGNEEGSIRA